MNVLIRTVDKPIHANVVIPGSKSLTNRALLLAALADGVSEISSVLVSDDTCAFVDALHALGVMVQLDKEAKTCIVGGCTGIFPKKEATIWCAGAGTVARFLLAAVAATPGIYQFDGSSRLRERPISHLLEILSSQGAVIEPPGAKKMPFTLQGTDELQGGQILIDGSQTGQFVSALLMIAPFAKSPMVIDCPNLVSRSYIDMTDAIMAEFGVLVHRHHQSRFSVPVPQRYIAHDYMIEPDLSTASYFFAAAAITAGKITMQPIRIKESKQGDLNFLTILQKMGCKIEESNTGLSVEGPKELQGINVDLRDYSDIFMTLAAIAPFAKTPTTMTNIAHTRLQESNRITAMREGLQKLNAKVEEGPDWIKIYPSVLKGNSIDAHDDHRIAMSFSIIGLRVSGIEIIGAECVAKTCPDFFKLWNNLYL